MRLRIEFTVEPFVEGAPEPYVHTAVETARAHGLEVEFGPFGTVAEGDANLALAAVGPIVQAAIEAGASRVSIQISRT
jgi:uncharacterized protein YqgV (UPF0045/DUF77 family)